MPLTTFFLPFRNILINFPQSPQPFILAHSLCTENLISNCSVACVFRYGENFLSEREKSSFMLFIHFDYGRKMLTASYRSVANSIVSMAEQEMQPFPHFPGNPGRLKSRASKNLNFCINHMIKFKIFGIIKDSIS